RAPGRRRCPVRRPTGRGGWRPALGCRRSRRRNPQAGGGGCRTIGFNSPQQGASWTAASAEIIRDLVSGRGLAGGARTDLATCRPAVIVREGTRPREGGFFVAETRAPRLGQGPSGRPRRTRGVPAARSKEPAVAGSLDVLTEREREVMALVGIGLSNDEI